jgi:excisionase family DNA binding protein
MDPARYLTTAAAAARLGVTPARVRQLVLAGRLRSVKVGRDHFFRPADVAGYQRGRAGRPAKAT